jgi:putative membrane protein
MMGGGMMGGFGLFGGLIGLIFNLLIIVGIVVLIVWAVKRFSGGSINNQTSGNQSPREIVQARYARGELTREQYQQMLQDLS